MAESLAKFTATMNESALAVLFGETLFDDLVETLCKRCDGRGAAIVGIEPQSGRQSFEASHNISSETLVDLLQRGLADPALPLFMRQPVGRVTPRFSLMDEGDYRRSAVWNDVYRPHDIYDTLGVILHADADFVAYLAIQGANDRGRFDARDIESFSAVAPLLAKMARLRRRMARTEAGDLTAALLDSHPASIVLLDGLGRVKAMNSAALGLCGKADGPLRYGDGKLESRHRSEQAGLDRLLASVRELQRVFTAPCAYLTDARGHRYEVCTVSLGTRGRGLCADGPGALLAVTALDDDANLPPAERLRWAFGLTAAEARCAGTFMHLASIDAVAAELGVSRHAVRKHLAALFEKTGTGNQAALMKKLLSIKVW